MRTRSRVWMGAACLLTGALLMGCGPSASEMQIQDLQQKLADAKAENQQLSDMLRVAQGNLANLERRALELQDLLNQANDQLARIPKLPENWEWDSGVAWTDIADDILFDSGKIDIKPQGRTKLQEIMRQIQTNETLRDRQIFVVGHTDTDPIRVSGWKDNLHLSVERGAAVVRALQQMGMPKTQLIAAGAGENHPKTTNATAQGKQLNRRVQIVAIRKPTTGTDTTTPTRGPGEARATRITP